LAVLGAATVLVVGFDAVTYAATGSSLILGRVNQSAAVTTVQNTGRGATLNLVTSSSAYPPITTNAKGLVPNLYAGRAANADKIGGLTLAQVKTAAKGSTGPSVASSLGTDDVAQFVVPAGSQYARQLMCSSGRVAIGAGFDASNSSGAVSVTYSRQNIAIAQNWVLEFFNSSGADQGVYAEVYCIS
jgi:hypothetical protein